MYPTALDVRETLEAMAGIVAATAKAKCLEGKDMAKFLRAVELRSRETPPPDDDLDVEWPTVARLLAGTLRECLKVLESP